MNIQRFESKYPAETMRDEVKKTLALLEAGNFVQVVGLPGTGKSTLLRLLAYNDGVRQAHLGEKSGEYHFVYMNFSEVKKRNLRDVCKLILLSLQQSLEERGMGDGAKYVTDKLGEALRLDDEVVYLQYLKQCVERLAEKGLKTVFLVDRLEVYYPYLDERFFTMLRILRNSAKHSFSAVFSLDRPLDVSLERDLTRDIYDLVAGNTVFVGIEHKEGLEFRMKHLEETLGKQCEEKMKKQLVGLTAGHGKLTKLCYEAALQEGCEHENLEKFLLGRRQVKGALEEIWGYFTPEEMQALLSRSAEIQEQVRDDRQEVVKLLESLGILRQNTITVPLFDKYIEGRKEQKQALSYDGEKRTIMRGDIDISENFSASEFRLLEYMLNNKDKIVTRDELVDHIWGELATREGVTPQAFDQLVYRVRKKIEADPSTPQILATVKGRGYRVKN